jgi:hypothetical protein
MKVTGTIKDVSLGLDGKAQVTLTINEKNTLIQSLDELSAAEKLSFEMKPYRAKRSLDANAYFFVLADKLAEKLNTTKEDVYKNAIRNIAGVSEIVCVKDSAAKKLCEVWEQSGLGYQTETFPSKIEGCTNVVLYYGSSTYDSAQMTRLIDHVVQDCKAVGIETKTPNEIAQMLALWEGR